MGRLRAALAAYAGFEPDARAFILAALLTGAAASLYWIDFNLYLASLGITPATIGLIATAGSLSSALVAFPASMLSDRIGHRLVLAGGLVIMLVAVSGFLVVSGPVTLGLLAAAYAAGGAAFSVVQIPFLAQRSRPEHRSELFALVFAVQSGTNVVGALVGGAIAAAVARAGGFSEQGPEAYRVLLLLMAGLTALAIVAMVRISDDRPAAVARAAAAPSAATPTARTRPAARRGPFVVSDPRLFFRLLLPGFLISLGAGQVIPFLNLFIQRKFGLELASLNAIFAITALGTMVAMLAQPILARRVGKIGSVVAVQAASLPFLLVLGFAPFLPLVIAAMAVRNSLMNAGSPIFDAFAMERVSPTERATLSAAMSLLWSVGWAIAGPWYSLLQATLGFDLGYSVNFVTIIALYAVATVLYWVWFGRDERAARVAKRAAAAAAGCDEPADMASDEAAEMASAGSTERR